MRGTDRARALGIPGDYSLLQGALHGIALRVGDDHLVPLPRARAWAERVAAALQSFQDSPG